MNCQKVKEFLYQYLDQELQEDKARDVKKHLSQCPLCQLAFEREEKFNGMIKDHVIKEEAPYELRESIINQLERSSKPPFFKSFLQLKPVLGIFVVVIFTTVFTFNVFLKESNAFPIFTSSINNHMEFLKGAYPMEIESADYAKVTQWFEGKLDFAVKVPKLKSDQAKLVGARICHLKDKKVGYVIYDVQGYQVSAFLVDTTDLKIPKSQKIIDGEHIHYVKNDRGYQSVLCVGRRVQGLGCIYVSNLPNNQLLEIII